VARHGACWSAASTGRWNCFVAAALALNADFIVSGDKHLLRLNGVLSVPVINAATAVAHWASP
jgi:predicted nucleic acid-binding protein